MLNEQGITDITPGRWMRARTLDVHFTKRYSRMFVHAGMSVARAEMVPLKYAMCTLTY